MGKGPGGGKQGKGPVSGGRITNGYGPRTDPVSGKKGVMHHGVDIGVAKGTPVKATGGGTVVRAGWQSKDHSKGFGQRVTIDHGNGNTSTSGHMSRVDVQKGDKVKSGQQIGLSGNSGKSTGPHVHYEERNNGQSHPPTYDPAHYTPKPPRLRVDFV